MDEKLWSFAEALYSRDLQIELRQIDEDFGTPGTQYFESQESRNAKVSKIYLQLVLLLMLLERLDTLRQGPDV